MTDLMDRMARAITAERLEPQREIARDLPDVSLRGDLGFGEEGGHVPKAAARRACDDLEQLARLLRQFVDAA